MRDHCTAQNPQQNIDAPQSDVEPPAAAVERMRENDAWMKANGEAIYGTRPIAPYKHGNVVFARKGQTGFPICFTTKESESVPEQPAFSGLPPESGSKMQLLGARAPVSRHVNDAGRTTVDVPAATVKSPPCQHALVFKFALAGQNE